jgi:hypothetical protein
LWNHKEDKKILKSSFWNNKSADAKTLLKGATYYDPKSKTFDNSFFRGKAERCLCSLLALSHLKAFPAELTFILKKKEIYL